MENTAAAAGDAAKPRSEVAGADAGSELAGFRASRPIIHTRNYFSAAARHCEIFKSPFPSREVEEERSEGRKEGRGTTRPTTDADEAAGGVASEI